MRIGISAFSHKNQNIWSNGLGQNVMFLVQSLRKISFVRDVVLIDAGSEEALSDQIDLDKFGTRIMRQKDATDRVDVVIELAGALGVPWLDLQRARGKKVIYHCVGQPHSSMVDTAIFNRSGFFLRPDRFDEVWLLPKDAVFAPMMRTLHRCPVQVAPYLWSPHFLENRIRELEAIGHAYGFKPVQPGEGSIGWRVTMFEPNLAPIKSSLIPMLVCDVAERRWPGTLSMMYALNTGHLVNHPTLLHLANSLDLVKSSRAVFTGRHDIAGFMSQHGLDAAVAHQWQNDQNYSYLDVLHGDYPLIHNSPWLKEAGYYYPDFNIEAGAAQLALAKEHHQESLPDYRERSRRVFKAVDPDSEDNARGYAELLMSLAKDRPEWLTA
ncbi:DUF2827 family protein [Ottowia thiooxydans]|uniref:DUF2827 family protein n=1 Tax=Ottowia thiooxydans TaxID=219182 RepID=UPI000403BC55|nr:DUF2827 family protein [Ottowia thiooxydans]